MPLSSSTRTGQLSELKFTEFCLKAGYDVFKPVFECNQGFDFVVDFNDGLGLKKVQVKTAHHNDQGDGNIYRMFHNGGCSNRGTKGYLYQKGDYDILAAIDLVTNQMWLFPFDAISHKTHLVSRVDNTIVKPGTRTFDWRSYEVSLEDEAAS